MIKEWNLRKYLNQDEGLAVARVKRRRETEGKRTEIRLRGRLFSEEKTSRTVRRKNGHLYDDVAEDLEGTTAYTPSLPAMCMLILSSQGKRRLILAFIPLRIAHLLYCQILRPQWRS